MTVASQPDTRLRPLLTRDYVHFRQEAADGATWPATPATAVTLIINLGAAFGGLPSAIESNARGWSRPDVGTYVP